MRKVLQEFLNHVDSKPSELSSGSDDHVQWFNTYEEQKARMINLFNSLFNTEEMQYVHDLLTISINGGEEVKNNLNKTILLQDAIKNIYGESAGIHGISGMARQSISNDLLQKSIKDMDEKLKRLNNLLEKIRAMIGITEIQSLTSE